MQHYFHNEDLSYCTYKYIMYVQIVHKPTGETDFPMNV